jgi:hypothetical protein
MQFGLLLSHLPHVDEARAHYDAMLALGPVGQSTFKLRFANCLRRVKALFA